MASQANNGSADPIPADVLDVNDLPNPAMPPPSNQSGVYVPVDLDNGQTPMPGDVDPDSTASAEATGQDGDPTEEKKNTANAWN